MTAIGIGNGTRFFADDDDDGIGQFADADGRPVARPQFRRQGPVRRQRQQTAGSHDAVLAYDDGPVMERGIGDEYISQQFPRHQAVDGNARVDIIVEADFAFKDDERPCMGLL